MSWDVEYRYQFLEALEDLYNVQELFQIITLEITESRGKLKKKLGLLGMLSIKKDPELKELTIVVDTLENILRNVEEAIQNTECLC